MAFQLSGLSVFYGGLFSVDRELLLKIDSCTGLKFYFFIGELFIFWLAWLLTYIGRLWVVGRYLSILTMLPRSQATGLGFGGRAAIHNWCSNKCQRLTCCHFMPHWELHDSPRSCWDTGANFPRFRTCRPAQLEKLQNDVICPWPVHMMTSLSKKQHPIFHKKSIPSRLPCRFLLLE